MTLTKLLVTVCFRYSLNAIFSAIGCVCTISYTSRFFYFCACTCECYSPPISLNKLARICYMINDDFTFNAHNSHS